MVGITCLVSYALFNITSLAFSSSSAVIGPSIWQLNTYQEAGNNIRQEPKANTNAAYKFYDLAYKILKV